MFSRFYDEDDEQLYSDVAGIETYWHSPLFPLERATQTLSDIIPNINALVKEGKTECYKSPHGLTQDESAAIYLYTMETGKQSVYRILNRVLRRKIASDILPWFLYLKLLTTALNKLPSYSGNVWRGVNGDVAKRYRKNTRLCWWAFTSCTKSISILKQFVPTNGNNGTIFMIECANGKDISAYSSYRKEDEIILMSGIKLVAMDESLPMNELRVVHLKEISNTIPLSARPAFHQNNHDSGMATKALTPTPWSNPHFKKEATMPTTHFSPKSASQQKKLSDEASKKINCPHCSTTLVFSSTYKSGGRITCCNCNQTFNEVSCPFCYKSNFWRNANYHAGRKIKCANCQKVFQHLNCPHCSKGAFWRAPNEHKSGFNTHCRSCGQDYHALNCPNCHMVHYFKNDTYKPGLPITCRNCKKAYQQINCPNCSEPCVWKNADRISGYRVTCHKCTNIFQHVNCPHCQGSNFWDNGKYTERARVTCCNCGRLYQHTVCPHCKKSNFFKYADLKSNDRVNCWNCNESF